MKTVKLRASGPGIPARHSVSRTLLSRGAACLALLPFLGAVAQAGEITALTWHSGVGSVAGEFIVPPSAPNNDDVAGPSPNIIYVLQKNYIAIGPVDLVFDVVATGGATEYRFVEGVANNTGLNWLSYHLELGYGHGSGFVKATSGDPLDFDAPDYNSGVSFAPFYSTVMVTEHDVIASGGIIPAPGYAGGLHFHIDVPDGIASFTLRQSPIVPEPAGILLLSIAAGLSCRRPRGKRAGSAG